MLDLVKLWSGPLPLQPPPMGKMVKGVIRNVSMFYLRISYGPLLRQVGFWVSITQCPCANARSPLI